MGVAGYIVTNLAGNATVTLNNADSVYTYASLYDGAINKPFRWTAKTGNWILFSFSGAQSIDCYVIHGHNFTSGATVTINAGTTNACSNFASVMTWADDHMFKIFADQSYQYWNLTVTDAGNPDAYIEMRELVMGQHVPFSSAIAYGFEEGVAYTNDLHQTEFGTLTAYERFSNRTFRCQWPPASTTVRDEVKALYNACKGSLTPFSFFPAIDGADTYFARLAGNYAAQAAPPPYYTVGLELREESMGKVVA